MKRLLLSWICLMAAFGAAVADVDVMFEEAREAGRAGRHGEARKICKEILAEAPGYVDVRLYLARLHLWDRQLADARTQFERVLKDDPYRLDALMGRVDVELQAHAWFEAVLQADKALKRHPRYPELLFRRALALEDLGYGREALEDIRLVLIERPDWEQAQDLQQRLFLRYPRYKFSADILFESFDDIDDWYDLVLQLQGRYRGGFITGRVTLADRFSTNAEQYEVDVYHRAGPGYFYFNAGYSDSTLFPEQRYGAEYFFPFSRDFEASVGVRHLDFRVDTVTLYTGTIGMYRGNWFIWLRPFYADRDSGDETSATLSARLFGKDVESHWTASIGAGSTPDADLVTPELERSDEWRVGLAWQQTLGRAWIVRARVGARSQEFATGNRDSWSLGVGFSRLFD
ncbi:hypothetical protein ABI59_13260 [Acidobacteria bacterium Mor1]|nr:hypothetical protein ABI59_13260 [Acidobacteria bacterium Mor1]